MKKFKLVILTVIMVLGLCLGTNAAVKNTAKTPVKPAVTTQKQIAVPCDNAYELTNSLNIIANPNKYLNKRVKIKAKFDKFSTLGLDYKPAYRSSDKYITFLIKRDDITNHNIPLSEMKNFLAREEAEKYIDLKTGDEIEYCGVVFSNALGDVWINVDKFTVLNPNFKPQNPTKK